MKRAFVLGLGSSGLAAARLLAADGVIPVVGDDRAIPDAVARQLPPESVIVEPPDFARALDDVDEVVVSPGIPSTHPLITAARARCKRVVSELELASRSLSVPLLAVTGTNGKSTTVALLGRIVQASGRRTFTGGNLGRPLSLAVFENPEICVVEVSSFQLEWVETFHPRVASVLNVSPDHLDRHGDMESYVRTKLRMFERMRDDDAIVLAHDQTWWRRVVGSWSAPLSTFGPWPVPAAHRDASGYERRERVVRTTSGQIFALADAWPRAPHDFANATAAIELARRAGVEQSAIEQALRDFRPLPHRLGLVAVHEGVAYWNDSKATNVGAALASLEAFDQPVILMAGGVAKGADLSLLREGIAKLKTVVAYGEAAPAIEAALAADVPVIRASGFDAAFEAARSAAVRGDVVLLAPACASFDEFSGYDARGRRFCELVEVLRRGGSGGKG